MDKKHPLDTDTNEDNSIEEKNLEEKRAQAEGTQTHEKDKAGTDTLLKSLAIVGIVLLIIIGLYGSMRVLANLPDFGRSLASGFVSVTSQFFGADEDEDGDDRVIVIEEDDPETSDDDGAGDDGEEEIEEPTSQTPGQPQTPTGTRTIEREFRIVPQTISQPVSDPNGDVDLEVSILAVGKIHPQTRDFVEQDTLDEDDTGAVVFEVKNVGTKTSEEWEYRVTFPTEPRHTFDSDEQMELRPGERIEYTISFDSLSEDNNEFAVEVDPGREIEDDDRSNNRIEIDIDIRD